MSGAISECLLGLTVGDAAVHAVRCGGKGRGTRYRHRLNVCNDHVSQLLFAHFTVPLGAHKDVK